MFAEQSRLHSVMRPVECVQFEPSIAAERPDIGSRAQPATNNALPLNLCRRSPQSLILLLSHAARVCRSGELPRLNYRQVKGPSCDRQAWNSGPRVNEQCFPEAHVDPPLLKKSSTAEVCKD